MKKQTTVLVIMDGYGYRKEIADNAIASASTPTLDFLFTKHPYSLLSGSGLDVGLPKAQMGNSEVGHISLGSGRILYQSLMRITNSIKDHSFFQKKALVTAIDQAIQKNKAIHLISLVSPGGVHSHEDHLHATIKLAAKRGAKHLYIHAFLDGRDTPPKSASVSLKHLEDTLKTLGVGEIVSLVGRYYAMDRDKRWERTQQAYELITERKAQFQAASALQGLEDAYARNETDEFVQATAIGKTSYNITNSDTLIFSNFRADRAQQLSYAFADPNFTGFSRKKKLHLLNFITFTSYASDLQTSCVFPPQDISNTLGEYLSALNKTQLRIAETEKYAHVTYFLNGGREAPYKGENRILIDSPKVATYDLKPEMNAELLTHKLVEAINSGTYDFIACNYANCDMVGHTGNFLATVKAVETVDTCLKKILHALDKAQGQCLITADHGNAELMRNDKTGQPHTSHTCQPVPLIYAGNQPILELKNGVLADVAPTLLDLMHLPIPKEMTGNSLAIKPH